MSVPPSVKANASVSEDVADAPKTASEVVFWFNYFKDQGVGKGKFFVCLLTFHFYTLSMTLQFPPTPTSKFPPPTEGVEEAVTCKEEDRSGVTISGGSDVQERTESGVVDAGCEPEVVIAGSSQTNSTVQEFGEGGVGWKNDAESTAIADPEERKCGGKQTPRHPKIVDSPAMVKARVEGIRQAMQGTGTGGHNYSKAGLLPKQANSLYTDSEFTSLIQNTIANMWIWSRENNVEQDQIVPSQKAVTSVAGMLLDEFSRRFKPQQRLDLVLKLVARRTYVMREEMSCEKELSKTKGTKNSCQRATATPLQGKGGLTLTSNHAPQSTRLNSMDCFQPVPVRSYDVTLMASWCPSLKWKPT